MIFTGFLFAYTFLCKEFIKSKALINESMHEQRHVRYLLE
ncbi:hypothetical protein FHR92_002277 [Fontibacillus solani]|uniref:Uncharacterized protein n=1 Tax=Fontibacillus solani TaxID=1572857 RepID=A0A7W3STC0_9BACL|nr:hypothetical protein [Fontibacillus solani]